MSTLDAVLISIWRGHWGIWNAKEVPLWPANGCPPGVSARRFDGAGFLASLLRHVPAKGHQRVRWRGWCSNRQRGDRRRRGFPLIAAVRAASLPKDDWRTAILRPGSLLAPASTRAGRRRGVPARRHLCRRAGRRRGGTRGAFRHSDAAPPRWPRSGSFAASSCLLAAFRLLGLAWSAVRGIGPPFDPDFGRVFHARSPRRRTGH